MPQTLKRRNISCIYIFDTFPSDDRRKPTCIEDCRPSVRRQWMMNRTKEYLRNVISELAASFKELADYCHKEGAIKDEWRDEFIQMADRWIEKAKWNWAEHELADQIDIICGKITLLADSAGVIRQRTNDDDSIAVVDDDPHENKQP